MNSIEACAVAEKLEDIPDGDTRERPFRYRDYLLSIFMPVPSIAFHSTNRRLLWLFALIDYLNPLLCTRFLVMPRLLLAWLALHFVGVLAAVYVVTSRKGVYQARLQRQRANESEQDQSMLLPRKVLWPFDYALPLVHPAAAIGLHSPYRRHFIVSWWLWTVPITAVNLMAVRRDVLKYFFHHDTLIVGSVLDNIVSLMAALVTGGYRAYALGVVLSAFKAYKQIEIDRQFSKLKRSL